MITATLSIRPDIAAYESAILAVWLTAIRGGSALIPMEIFRHFDPPPPEDGLVGNVDIPFIKYARSTTLP